MALVLFLVIVALVLGIIGVLVEGLFFLLILGVAVFLADVAYAALHWRRTGRRPVR
ncbi:hypothetical protein [Streptomyces sp. NPDC051219]|uniref:hypothetical protein n=1 Tax=Streptomyces sp. NPDC051219 TaxID=3155283 RepID=UPI0034284218